MVRVAKHVLEQRQAKFLCVVLQRAKADGIARMSNSQVANAMGLSIGQVRRTSHILVERGLLELRPQYLYNGGQVENAYVLTPAGQAHIGQLQSEQEIHDVLFPTYRGECAS